MTLDGDVNGKYDERFDEGEVRLLEQTPYVAPSRANRYNADISAELIRESEGWNVSPEKANEFWPAVKSRKIRGGPKVIKWLTEAGLTLEETLEYPLGSYDGKEIAFLRSGGVSGKKVHEYTDRDIPLDLEACPSKNLRFLPESIVQIEQAGCDVKAVHGYARWYLQMTSAWYMINSAQILALHHLGIKPQDLGVDPDTLEYSSRGLEFSLGINNLMEFLRNTDMQNYELIGTGSNAAIVLDRERRQAIKFSRDIEKEAEFLWAVWPNKNVVSPMGYVELDGLSGKYKAGIRLEYIDGESLAQKLKDERALDPEQVLKYGHDILKGLLDIRMKGIYHRDIHEKNVLIDGENDRAVIIDLGLATKNPNDVYKQNRRYGGNNDLVSLGQLMYKMVTGHNLFNEGYGLSYTPEAKDGIKASREQSYRRKLSKFFGVGLSGSCIKQVKQNVQGPLRRVILSLLDDNYMRQPSKIRYFQVERMFREAA
ncbi:protein kinase [Candidatus Woesearchaeota archaeon]|nr:protein kinase [Candidatus Woesearchaeota archaeon]